MFCCIFIRCILLNFQDFLHDFIKNSGFQRKLSKKRVQITKNFKLDNFGLLYNTYGEYLIENINTYYIRNLSRRGAIKSRFQSRMCRHWFDSFINNPEKTQVVSIFYWVPGAKKGLAVEILRISPKSRAQTLIFIETIRLK